MDILAPASIKNLRQIKKFCGEERSDLPQMYQTTYSRIKSNDAASAEIAQVVLVWICFAQRPLHEVELEHAIATEIGDEDFDSDGITAGDLLRSSCMGLVVCDDERTYSLLHLTAYEFFRSNPDMSSTAKSLLISKTCLTYLSFSSTGRQGPCADLAALEARKSDFRLLDYAAKHSADHIRQVEVGIIDDVFSLLCDDTLRQAFMQAFYHQHRDDEDLRRITFETLPSGSSPLQVACGRGLILTAARLLQCGADEREADLQGWTPLIAATSYGQLEAVKLLLSRISELEEPDTSGLVLGERPNSSPRLFKRHERIDHLDEAFPYEEDSVKRRGDNVGLNQPDNDGWTPLFWAIIKN